MAQNKATEDVVIDWFKSITDPNETKPGKTLLTKTDVERVERLFELYLTEKNKNTASSSGGDGGGAAASDSIEYEKLKRQIDTMASKLQLLITSTSDETNKINTQVDTILREFNKLTERYQEANDGLKSANLSKAELESKLAEINLEKATRIADLEAQLTAIRGEHEELTEAKNKRIEELISSMVKDIGSIRVDLGALKQINSQTLEKAKIDRLGEGIERIQERSISLKALNTKLRTMVHPKIASNLESILEKIAEIDKKKGTAVEGEGGGGGPSGAAEGEGEREEGT